MNQRFRTGALMLGCVFLPGSVAFAQATTSVPPLGPSRSLSLPAVSQSALPNGLRVIIVEDHRQPSLYVILTVAGGIVKEPVGKAGLASLTIRLLTDGTMSQDYTGIADKIDASGATLKAEAEPDYSSVAMFGLAPQAGEFCDLIADLTQHPLFPAGAIAAYQQVAPSGIANMLSNAAALASASLERTIYGSSAYGNLSTGTLDSIKTFTRDDVQTFYDKNFTPSSSVLFFVGDITDSAARALALKSFGGWSPRPGAAATAAVTSPPPKNAAVPVAAEAKPTITIIDRPGAQQTEIRIGARAGGYSDPQRIAGDLATAVLGAGQFESRLTHEVRVTRGLTYGISSAFDRNRDAGEFAIRTFTKNVSTGEVLRLVLDEVRKIARTPPTAAELADHKTYLNGNFAVSVASTEGFLGELFEAVLYGEGMESLSHYTDRVNAVTGDDVSKVIAGLHLENARIVLVGDAKAIEPQVHDLGSVTVIEPDDLDLLSPNLRRSGGAP